MQRLLPIVVTAANIRSCVAGGLLNGIYLTAMALPLLTALALLRVL